MDLSSRRTGRSVGAGSIGVAVASLVVALTAGKCGTNFIGASALATTAAAAGLAWWLLLSRKYLNDPEARREYLAALRGYSSSSSSLSSALAEFSNVASLVHLLTPQSVLEDDTISVMFEEMRVRRQGVGVSSAATASADHKDAALAFVAAMLLREVALDGGLSYAESITVDNASDTIAGTRLSRLVRFYSGSQLSDLCSSGAVTAAALRSAFLNDVQEARTFADLTAAVRGGRSGCGEAFGSIAAALAAHRVMTRETISPLLSAEFPWVRSFASNGNAIAPHHHNGASSSSSSAAGAPLCAVVRSVAEHHKTLTAVFGVPKTDLSAIIEEAPQNNKRNGRGSNNHHRVASHVADEDGDEIVAILEAGLVELAGAGITSRAYRDGLLERSAVTEDTLWAMEPLLCGKSSHREKGLQSADICAFIKEVGIGVADGDTSKKRNTKCSLLASKCFSSKALRAVFAASVPADALFGSRGSNRAGITPRNNLAAFLLYWDATLRTSPEICPPKLVEHLQRAHAAAEAAAAPLARAYAKVDALKATEAVARAQGGLERGGSALHEYEATKEELKKTEASLPTFEEALHDACFGIHRQFAPKIAAIRAEAAASGLTLNCAHM